MKRMYKKLILLYILNTICFALLYASGLIRYSFFQTVLTYLLTATTSTTLNRILMLFWISVPQLVVVSSLGHWILHLPYKKIALLHALWILSALLVLSVIFSR